MRPRARGVARRYARALLEVASEQGRPADLLADLQQAVTLLAEHPDLAKALSHPALPLSGKKAVLAEVFRDGQGSELLRRLLGLLVERDRLELLPDVERIYGQLWDAQRGVVSAEAVTAVPLEPAQARALGETLGRHTGREVELRLEVDPAVMGGLLVRMGGRVYDGTVRGRLRGLRERLGAAPRPE